MSEPVLYPVFLKLDGLHCLVVGGGVVAERKIETLIETAAAITIVSPEITNNIKEMIFKYQLTWIRDIYRSTYLDGKHLVISATNNSTVNENIFKETTERRIFLNSVDDPERCSFIVPASCRKGDIQIAVCTNGAAPGISAMIRNELAGLISNRTVKLVNTVKCLRSRIKKLQKEYRKEFWDFVFALNLESFKTDDELVEKIHEMLKSKECN